MTAQPSNCKHVSERFLLYNSDWWHMQSVKISPSLRQRRMRRRGTASSLQPMPSCGHNTYLWVPRIGRMELQIKVTSNVTTSSRRKAHLYIWLQSATNHAYSCAILLPKPVRPTADANSGDFYSYSIFYVYLSIRHSWTRKRCRDGDCGWSARWWPLARPKRQASTIYDTKWVLLYLLHSQEMALQTFASAGLLYVSLELCHYLLYVARWGLLYRNTTWAGAEETEWSCGSTWDCCAWTWRILGCILIKRLFRLVYCDAFANKNSKRQTDQNSW